MMLGWRFYFYPNEGKEPMHIHCENAERECKLWMYPEDFELEVAYQYNMNNRDLRIVKKIVYENFEYIESEWRKYHEHD
jgi:hypothetical protein